MITFACYKGNGRRWPGCKAGGSVHSAMHSLSQARGSGGDFLDSALPSKVWYGPPPHGSLKCLLAVFSCARFLLGLLCRCGDAVRLNKSGHIR